MTWNLGARLALAWTIAWGNLGFCKRDYAECWSHRSSTAGYGALHSGDNGGTSPANRGSMLWTPHNARPWSAPTWSIFSTFRLMRSSASATPLVPLHADVCHMCSAGNCHVWVDNWWTAS
ncbi:hypothetical protein CRG98_015508 [Punica granatum]|uniref:Secreted protein n=1 Tax=Punica granatum TaxID=22663 RepID=A0A2I0K687_PUNGR|nr:hypothetical protein CRG98_015508 [Punica granatum]